MSSLAITSVEDCWGTLLDYVLVAESGELYGEKQVNQQLFNAIDDGSMSADASMFPIVVE